MTKFRIVEPYPVAAIAASRGSGVENLLAASPKNVWADTASGSEVTISIDLGEQRLIDTVMLGHVLPPAAGARWTVRMTDQVVGPESALRVPDVAGTFPAMSHALWTASDPVLARHIRLTLVQPAGSPPLTAGSLVVGRSIAPALGQEWGLGRQPVDTGAATPLPDGGYAVIEGVRKRRLSWTFGDLSQSEVDRIELLALSVGETRPVLVVEDITRSAGLFARIVYGKFDRWRPFERRNRQQTRWEMAVEEWR